MQGQIKMMNGMTLLNVEDFRDYIHCGLSKARQLMKDGMGIYTVTIGSKKYVVKEKFEDYINSQLS